MQTFRNIYGIGEAVYDIIFKDDMPQSAVPGGSTLNSFITLGRCGLHPSLITETGDDLVAGLIRRYMEHNGVRTDFVQTPPGTKSHLSLAFLNEQNDAQYEYYRDHENAAITARLPVMTADDVVMFGSYFSINPEIRPHTLRFLETAQQADATIYYDLNFRKNYRHRVGELLPSIEENMRFATVVRGSLEDFGYLFDLTDPDEIYERHIRPHCPHFICTDGGREVVVFDGRGGRLRFDVPEVTTLSTIGAGDNFNAGFVYETILLGLRRADFERLSPELWTALIMRGQEFSLHVVQSYQNYVDTAFGSTHRLPQSY